MYLAESVNLKLNVKNGTKWKNWSILKKFWNYFSLFLPLWFKYYIVFFFIFSNYFAKSIILIALKNKTLLFLDSVIFPMVKNMALLVIFVFQHSLQARKEVKDFLTFRGLNVLERLFYNIGSCLALQVKTSDFYINL